MIDASMSFLGSLAGASTQDWMMVGALLGGAVLISALAALVWNAAAHPAEAAVEGVAPHESFASFGRPERPIEQTMSAAEQARRIA